AAAREDMPVPPLLRGRERPAVGLVVKMHALAIELHRRYVERYGRRKAPYPPCGRDRERGRVEEQGVQRLPGDRLADLECSPEHAFDPTGQPGSAFEPAARPLIRDRRPDGFDVRI